MIKNIFISIGVLFSFSLLFLFGFDKINVLAMGNFENSIGTIPVRIDINNYDKINLIPDDNEQFECYATNRVDCVVTQGVKVTTSTNSSTGTRGYSIITKDLSSYITETGTYTLTLFTENNEIPVQICMFGNSSSVQYGCNGVNKGINYLTFQVTEEKLGQPMRIVVYNTYNSYVVEEINIINFMITKGNVPQNSYSSYFKFGYEVDLVYSISTTGSNTTINYYFNDLTFSKTTDLVSSGYLIENYYIPFNIDDTGYISLSNLNFGISSIISNNTNNSNYSLQLQLKPVFNAYYKGEYTNNIYTKLNYMSNDLFFSGITFSGCKGLSCSNTINAGNLSLLNNKTLAVTELNETGSISNTNVSTYYTDEIMNRNYFNYNNYLNVSFKIGDLAMDYNYMNGRNYTFGISSLSSRIVDNETTTAPLPINPNTIDKYNSCSAWYDIPCQLGNAITFVIYEAPIVSPVLTFIVSFVTMFSSLVSFVDLFRSFGIVFGCFIIYMLIELLHKYSK